MLLTLGRAEEAERLLREVLNGLPRDSATLPRAAYALAHALMQCGRGEEARQLAGEYGFELD
ncbi:tetratricopeptide repeat protein [Catellatospora coxensis]